MDAPRTATTGRRGHHLGRLGPALVPLQKLVHALHPVHACCSAARGELLAALIAGCRKVPGQLGYYRAMAGLQDAVGNLDVLARHLPGAAVKALKEPELRKLITVKQVSFESALKKRTQVLLAS